MARKILGAGRNAVDDEISTRHGTGLDWCAPMSDFKVNLKSIRILGTIILQADPALLDNFFKPRDVLQKTFAGEAEKIIAELWILEVDLQQPVIGHGQDFAILSAFDRLRPSIVRRQEAELTHETSGRDLDAEFGH